MTVKEHSELIEQIRTTEDTAERSNLLLQLANDYTEVSTTLETKEKELEKVATERDTFAQANNKLWLQLSSSNEPNKPNVNIPPHEEEPPTKRTFEALEEKFL